ncbi:MAG: hypothetical protein AB8I08_16255 [Sandaracinaceae bacterium]
MQTTRTLLAGLAALTGLLFAVNPASAQPALSCDASPVAQNVLLNENATLTVTLNNTGDAVGFLPGVGLPLPPGMTVTAVDSDAAGATFQTVGLNGSGNGTHPITNQAVSGPNSGTFTFIRPRISNLAPATGAITFTITLGVADPLEVYTEVVLDPTCEFAYGTDALNNASTDAPIEEATIAGITPVVITGMISGAGKDGSAATVTGPLSPVTWTVTFDVAGGVDLTSADWSFAIPSNFSVTGVSATGPIMLDAAPGGVGGTLTGLVGPVMGAAGSAEVVITIAGFVPEFDESSDPVLDPATGAPVDIDALTDLTNYVFATPDLDAAPELLEVGEMTAHSILVSESIASGPYCPGETVSVDVDVCVSDYFTFETNTLETLYEDGLTFTMSSDLATMDDGSVLSTAFGTLDGTAAVGTPAMYSVTYTFTVDETYTGGAPVLGGDSFDFLHDGGGTIMGGSPQSSDGTPVSDGTVNIKEAAATKEVVAINGVPFTGTETISPGDVVTFRLTTSFESGDQADFTLTDFLPPPKFDALENGAGPTIGLSTSSDPVRFGPAHDLPVGVTTATSASDNSITFTAPAFSVPSGMAPLTFQVDMDYTVSTAAFDDDFTIVNFARFSTGNTVGSVTGAAAAEVVTGEPFIRLFHGAIQSEDEDGTVATGVTNGNVGPSIPMTTASLMANPLTSQINRSSRQSPDAGDTVTWRVIADNQGRHPAHGVRITDAFRTGNFLTAPTNFTVTDGDGNALAFTGGATAEGFDITLTNPLPATDGDGESIVVITFETDLEDEVDALHTNTADAEVVFYTSTPTATDNYAPIHPESGPIARQARSRDFFVDKVLVAGAADELAVQDTTSYQITWSIPEGQHSGLQLEDRMTAGLALVGTPMVSSSLAGVTFSGATTASVSNEGRNIDISLGTVDNTNRDSSVTETVTMTFDAVATNVASNVRGARPNNVGVARSTGRTRSINAQRVTILEPELSLTTTADPNPLRPGDTATITVTIQPTSDSNATAHDAQYSFMLPAGLENLMVISGPSTAPDSMSVDSTSVSYGWDAIGDSDAPITFTLQVTVGAGTTPGDIDFPGSVTWTSQPGTPSVMTDSTLATERTGVDGAGGLNDYTASPTGALDVRECLSVADCVDGNACTADTCSAAGVCGNTAVAATGACIGTAGVCTGPAGTPANFCEVCLDDNATPGAGDSGCLGLGQCVTMAGSGMHMCVTCQDTATGSAQDDGCAGGTPYCDPGVVGGACVACLVNDQCGTDERCDLGTNTCVPFSCGDGVLDVGENCDLGTANNGPDATCSDSCRFNVGSGPCDTDTDCEGSAVCNASMVCAPDSDGDGIDDVVDPDDDNDGVLDETEGRGTDPSLDTDGDSIPDYLDPDAVGFVDDNGDDVDDRYDFDGDGVPNHLDLDADNDGLSDAFEGGGDDIDGDGLLDGCVDTTPENGVCDSADTTPLPIPNTDTDGDPDFLDLDADGDGITDASESGATDMNGDGIPDDFVDGDGDGVLDGGLTLDPTDTDGDGTPDHLSLDSDADSIPDAIEGHDADMDGVADVSLAGADTDGDGIDDAFDPDCAPCDAVTGVAAPEPDTDMDDVPDYQDLDADGDGISDETECGPLGPPMCRDSDMDGTPDYLETDSDNDGVPDATEAYDVDGDGTADFTGPTPTGVDDDMDGIDNAFDPDCTAGAPCTDGVVGFEPNLPDSDDDGIPDYRDTDDDMDGIPTATEVADAATHGGNPDMDGIPPYLDLDSDGDGATDAEEGADDPTRDIDGDDIPDYLDPDAIFQDTDGDGVPDHIECPSLNYATDPTMCRDTDGDGTPDFQDLDDDGDGILTMDELMLDMSDDNDADMDGVPSYLDLDSDGDGIVDVIEAGGTDADMDGFPDGCVDTDPEDGACDGLMLEVPNTDGVSDGADPYDTDADQDGILDGLEAFDADGDGTADITPSGTDADGDGIDDAFDPSEGGSQPTPADQDEDGVPNHLDLDSDGDGILDAIECGDDLTMCRDTDGDGTPDVYDLDSDDDGLPDLLEGHDANNDGVADRAPSGTDADGDGLDDAFDPDQGGTMAPLPDVDSDGLPNYRDVDSDGDGLLDSFECADAAACADTDSDGTPDYLDEDSDGDSIPDSTEAWDEDQDGEPDVTPSGTDANGDGRDDAYDTPSLPDTDEDGTPNWQDDDDDGDDIPTADEPGDADDSGVPDYLEPFEEEMISGGVSGGAFCAVGHGSEAPTLPLFLTLMALGWIVRRRVR